MMKQRIYLDIQGGASSRWERGGGGIPIHELYRYVQRH